MKPPVIWNRLYDSNVFPAIGPSWTLGDAGTAFETGYFTGSGALHADTAASNEGAYVEVNDVISNNEAGTIEFWWYKPGTVAGYMCCLGDTGVSGEFEILMRESGGNVHFFIFKRGGSPSQKYIDYNKAPADIDNGWNHVAFVWDRSGISGGSNTCRIYLNGSQETSSNAVIEAYNFPYPYPFTIGNAYNGGIATVPAVNSYFCNLKIYDYAKTDFNDRFDERGGIQDLLIIT